MTTPAEPSPPVVRLPSVESTQAVAWRLAAEGSPDRTVVVADHQSAGRGRRGRAWTDAPGTSLLVSILVRPRVPLGLWPLFSLTTAVAAAEALRRSTGLEARLKWPNDVLACGRKLGGILLESRGGAHDPALVIGVGLNLAQREFSLELAGLATAYRSAHDGLPEPLCAIWEPGAAAALESYQAGGGHCPRKFLIRHAVRLLEPQDRRALDNINTPEEYAEALAALDAAS